MHRVKPIVCNTPEELADAMGLSAAEAKEWQLQHALLKRLKEIVLRQGITDAEVAKRAGMSRAKITAILNGDLDHVSSDLLVRILAGLGYRVRVSVARPPGRLNPWFRRVRPPRPCRRLRLRPRA